MHENDEDLNDIRCMKSHLMTFVKSKIDEGLERIDAEDAAILGELVDMIKDFSEIETHHHMSHEHSADMA